MTARHPAAEDAILAAIQTREEVEKKWKGRASDDAEVGGSCSSLERGWGWGSWEFGTVSSSSVLGREDLEKVDETREGRRALVGWSGWAGLAALSSGGRP